MNFQHLASNRKIQVLVGLLVLCTFLIFFKDGNPATIDLNMGIEFAGGVRVPISLEKPVDAVTMAQVTETLKQRMNKFGLSQVTVRPLGNKEVLVELPQAQAQVIKTVESILREQGRFEALVGGKSALNSTQIIPSSIGGAQGEQINPDGSWQLVFSVTAEGELHFAEVASGKQGEQVYMFLDRPQNATLLVTQSLVPQSLGLSEALHKEGDDIGLVFLEDFNQTGLPNKPQLLIIPNTLKKEQPKLYGKIKALGYDTNVTATLRLAE
ncbi:MAG TPA: hypothetical protein VI874_04320, partial [Candidatus Norongarragalinales archaeon]|nr:hypothetical protein [Candidatus Norongarragalinales archaeon]